MAYRFLALETFLSMNGGHDRRPTRLAPDGDRLKITLKGP
jgi:hypothetical protein